ncbi:MAG: hypothetical protein FWC28_01545 [Proteobacteria bacterium]|nr:hypothetical protein [Pseudomonadota bacterium]
MTKQRRELSVVVIATFAISALSLLVGGIGILNIMLAAITERTQGSEHTQSLWGTQAAGFILILKCLFLLGALWSFGMGAGLLKRIEWVYVQNRCAYSACSSRRHELYRQHDFRVVV